MASVTHHKPSRHQTVTMSNGIYPFWLVGTDTSKSDDYQKDTLVYHFVSSKSGHRYVVHIERYQDDLHCVKFFDDTTDDRSGRFSHLTSTYEPRIIFRTVVEIALDVLRHNRKASFMYIGAADQKDKRSQPTRRYRVYKLYLSDFDLHEWFEPADFEEYFMYVLTNRTAMPTLEERMAFLKKIHEFVKSFSE